MILKVFDVDHGSCNFIMTETGKTELIDFGSKPLWSPVNHIYNNYIRQYGSLDRLVLTHHHGDHLSDLDNFNGRTPRMVVRRRLEGTYLTACRNSNSSSGQRLAERFSDTYDSWTGSVSDDEISEEAWGIKVLQTKLSNEDADAVSSTYNSQVNNSSYVRLYNHKGTKILLCGDIEKEGMELLLQQNPNFRAELKGLNVLIAPHHGHSSSFSADLFNATGQVDVVIASMMSGDSNVDSRYSDSRYVRGISFNDGTSKKLLTTRTYGAITVESKGYGDFQVVINQR
jgi:competence protein ComEC